MRTAPATPQLNRRPRTTAETTTSSDDPDDFYATAWEDESTASVQPPPHPANLDNLTLARNKGFFAFAEAPVLTRPEQLTRAGIKALGEAALIDYNAQRRTWHANLGPLRTPQLAELHEQLWDIVDKQPSNRRQTQKRCRH